MHSLNNYHYTDKEIKAILDSIIIIIDTREQENEHITDYFDKKKIAYRSQKLNTGDYSFCIPANSQLNIPREIHFDKDIAIERKATLEEISNNLTHERTAFENEMIRATRLKQFYLLIENQNALDDIILKNYKTDFNEKSFFSSLISFIIKYNIKLMNINKRNSGVLIYYILRNYLKSFLENKFYK